MASFTLLDCVTVGNVVMNYIGFTVDPDDCDDLLEKLARWRDLEWIAHILDDPGALRAAAGRGNQYYISTVQQWPPRMREYGTERLRSELLEAGLTDAEAD